MGDGSPTPQETSLPRYRQVANALRREIFTGAYAAGENLPTESSLCEQFKISRHTVREALRLLSEDGLIERQQGAGSVVTGRPGPSFVPPTGDFESILQYARDATFHLIESETPSRAMLASLGLEGDFRSFAGVRQQDRQQPIALNTIYILKIFAPPDETIDQLQESVSEWIERQHNVFVDRVDQQIDAVTLSAPEAAKLHVAQGTAALRTVRRYYDDENNIILLSYSLHPTERFAYSMTMKRKR